MIQEWLKEDIATNALMVAPGYKGSYILHPALKRDRNCEFIFLQLIHVFTPSSLRWALWMCRGSRTGTAISVHSSAALMMMAVDLLCSAFWAPELPALVRQGKCSSTCSSVDSNLAAFAGSRQEPNGSEQHLFDALKHIQLWSNLFVLYLFHVNALHCCLHPQLYISVYKNRHSTQSLAEKASINLTNQSSRLQWPTPPFNLGAVYWQWQRSKFNGPTSCYTAAGNWRHADL